MKIGSVATALRTLLLLAVCMQQFDEFFLFCFLSAKIKRLGRVPWDDSTATNALAPGFGYAVCFENLSGKFKPSNVNFTIIWSNMYHVTK